MNGDLADAVGFRVDVWIVQAMQSHSYGQLWGLSVHNTKREFGLECWSQLSGFKLEGIHKVPVPVSSGHHGHVVQYGAPV